MILSPAIIALVAGSFLVCAFAVYASILGIRIVGRWDMGSGDEGQLILERRTYLISTVLAYLLIYELLSLFVFIRTAEHMKDLFVGAMCAAGSLNVNEFGYPALVLRVATFILCGIWIIMNYTDSRGFDYPLIKTKYKLLHLITALLILETFLQTGYFVGLKADVITSCCGTLFSDEARGIAGDIAALPPYPVKVVFYLSVVLTVRAGVHFLLTGRSPHVFSYLSLWLLILSLVSIISFISVYFYELPTHHCPFCLFQKEYHYIGYPLYLSLLTAGITGAGVGVINRFKHRASLKEVIPALQRKLSLLSMVGYVVFTAISTYPMVFSDFKLESY